MAIHTRITSGVILAKLLNDPKVIVPRATAGSAFTSGALLGGLKHEKHSGIRTNFSVCSASVAPMGSANASVIL